MKLEFGRTYFIRAITIYDLFYTNWYDPNSWCMHGNSNYRACKDKNSNVDVAVYQGDEKQVDCGTLQITYGLEQADQIYSLACRAHGDTVLLTKSKTSTGAGEITIYEITVTAYTGNRVHRIKLKPCTA